MMEDESFYLETVFDGKLKFKHTLWASLSAGNSHLNFEEKKKMIAV